MPSSKRPLSVRLLPCARKTSIKPGSSLNTDAKNSSSKSSCFCSASWASVSGGEDGAEFSGVRLELAMNEPHQCVGRTGRAHAAKLPRSTLVEYNASAPSLQRAHPQDVQDSSNRQTAAVRVRRE